MKTPDKRNVYLKMQSFATTTKNLLVQGNIQRANTCLQIIDRLFAKGNNELKNAISNVYLYSLTSFLEMYRYDIKSLLPLSLQGEYYKQINTSSL